MVRDLAFWAQTATRFLLRSTRATLALSLMIVSAVAVMIFLSAMCVGINDAMVRNSVGLYSGHISGFDLPSSLAEESLRTKGVKAILKRTAMPGFLSRDGTLEPVTMIEVDPEQEAKDTAMPKKTISGRYLRKGERAVYLSLNAAEKLGARPGDLLYFRHSLQGARLALTVSGNFKTGFEQIDRGVAFCPRGTLGSKGIPWSAAIFLEEGIDPAHIVKTYQKMLPHADQFKPWSELMPDLRQLIDLNYVSMGIVLVLVFGVVSLGVGCAFVIFILKNLREFGIMKALGITPRETIALIVLKVILMSLAASCLALVLGALATLLLGRIGIDLSRLTSQNRYFTVSGIIFPRLTYFSLLAPPILALFSGLAAAIWPAVLVVRKRAADILRVI